MRYSFIAILLFILVQSSVAQSVKLVSAAKADWSGGIAGHYGTNYTFIVDFSPFDTSLHPDTIWLDKTPIALSGETGNLELQKMGKSLRATISCGTSHDDYADRYPVQEKSTAILPAPPLSYTGVALLSYSIKGRKKYFVIRRITKHYPRINYP